MALLDRVDASGDCARSGRLVFGCLIQALAADQAPEPSIGSMANPFNLNVAGVIRETIVSDLKGFGVSDGIEAGQQIHPQFLTDPNSRMELVGIVNRIDRQFIHDLVPGAEDHKRCGEVSLIYRFSYSMFDGAAASRLPVTMNVVFPAIPRGDPPGASNCAEVAARWTAQMERLKGMDAAAAAADLIRPGSVAALLDGRDIERIELNIQAYRISAGAESKTDLGSTAEYVIRVFRWNPDRKAFTPSFLTNQIDRARLLGDSDGDANSCDQGVVRPMSLPEFRAYTLSPVVLSDIDNGTLNIPQKFLACRATSLSPGGAVRSGNAPYWDAAGPAQQLFTDAQVTDALARARTRERQFSFMKSPVDMRMRLSELSCSGCHQSRAIAGFHFPGADRQGTPVSNSVYLPGSPHFFGDQSRRRLILDRLARGDSLNRYDLAVSYASRPLNKFKPQMAGTQLIGGWGATCLMPEAMPASQRQWDCQAGLKCTAIFESKNAPAMGNCLPADGRHEIGDPLQFGTVTSTGFRADRYLRVTPAPAGNWNDRATRVTLIPATSLPLSPPEGNGYYGAHQEFYVGNATGAGVPAEDRYRVIRDALTGGFPGGMLRLSECRGLPPESTCGLVASSGFNACLDQVKIGKASLAQCFATRTSYAGMRACDAASPCRDDYICLRPMGYSAADGHAKYVEHRKAVEAQYSLADYGQQEPDPAWLGRNNGAGDQRGVCIPPYFVFQFRSDGHPSPLTSTVKVVR
ncbi:MAG: hypothetical protein V4574_03170 [Pseudomonadota bacterium]